MLCNTGRLTEIPRNFPPETQEITITQQNIKSIPPNGKNTYAPMFLQFNQNNIIIEGRNLTLLLYHFTVFSKLKYLKRLILDSNNITDIRPFAFKVNFIYRNSLENIQFK